MTTAPTMTAAPIDPDLSEMMDSLLARYRRDTITPETEGAFDPELWASLTELGLSRLTGSVETGGSGAGLAESAALLSAAAAAAVPAPIAENDLLAGWLLEKVGLPVDDKLRTVARVDADGTATGVPWARHCDSIVVLRRRGRGWEVADLPVTYFQVINGVNIAGEPRDTVTVQSGSHGWIATTDTVATEFLLRGALARSVQVCGAMNKTLELCLEYVTARTQFGRPLAKFQAVQHLVADLAAESALAHASTDAAVAQASAHGWSDQHTEFLVAVAKSCVGHAASTVVRNAHQVHGAIGTTYEHDLHRLTKPMLAWRSEFGPAHAWDDVLTRAAVHDPRADTWAMITDGCAIREYLDTLL